MTTSDTNPYAPPAVTASPSARRSGSRDALCPYCLHGFTIPLALVPRFRSFVLECPNCRRSSRLEYSVRQVVLVVGVTMAVELGLFFRFLEPFESLLGMYRIVAGAAPVAVVAGLSLVPLFERQLRRLKRSRGTGSRE